MANLTNDFPNYLSYPSFPQFFRDAFVKWWGYPLLLLGISSWLAYKRCFPALVILWLASMGFLLLNAIGDPTAEHRFYVEVNLYPLLAFVLVPLIIDIFPLFRARSPKWLLPILVLFFAGRLLMIGMNSKPYTGRVDYVRHLAAEALNEPAQKQLIDPTTLDQEVLLMDWGLCYETLIASSSDLDGAVTLLPLADTTGKAAALNDGSLFVTPWATFPLEQLNERGYWQLDTAAYSK